MNLLPALMLGLFGSLHCVGMCGPIVLALPLNSKEKTAVVFQSLIYQLGRVITYAFLGMFMGMVGWGISISGFQKYLSIGLGILLIIYVAGAFSLEKGFLKFNSIRKWYSFISSKISQHLKISSGTSAFKVGLLNGFLPCGLVYIALASALLTETIWEGGLYMLVFGIGTIPLMMAVMIFGKYGRPYTRRLNKLIPVVLLLLGIYLVWRGMINMDIPEVAIRQLNSIPLSQPEQNL